MLGLPFVAVMPAGISAEKVAAVEHHGGRVHLVDDPTAIYDEAARLADACGGHYLDQFTYAERATDWRGNNNIAESVFTQLALERHPVPRWIVVGAGTGGTSATFGRYVRYRRFETRLAVVDPERSVFAEHWETGRRDLHLHAGSRIEGIGRPRVEPSFVAEVVDRIVRVPDAASLAAMRHLAAVLARRVGGSTGTNLWGAFTLVDELRAAGEAGSIVTLICDPGERYAHTYYDDGWVAAQGLDLAPATAAIDAFLGGGRLVA
jgi:cysteine synthase A